MRLRWWFLAVVVAAGIPRLLHAGRYVTTDEPTWMQRTVRFSDGIAGGDLSEATASLGEDATMPGGTTMWIGSIGRVLWRAAGALGVVDAERFIGRDGLAMAQATTAVVTALLVGALFVALARWVGLVPALVASILVATEPWVVALGAVLHTDSLTALFGTLGVVLLAHALGVPDPAQQSTRPTWTAALGGAALMASALTKVTGAGFMVGGAVIVAWALLRARGASDVAPHEGAHPSTAAPAGAGAPGRAEVDAHPTTPLRLAAVAALAGMAMVPVGWPALVVDPGLQVERLVASAGLSVEPAESILRGDMARQFFRGEPDDSPGWLYYPVALALRTTPWLLALLVVAVPAACAWASTRRHALVLVGPIVAFFVVISASPKKFDRYGLVLLVPLVVLVGLAIGSWIRSRPNLVRRRTAARVGGALGVALLVHAAAVAPWGLAYFNPALGGSRAGEQNLLVGWGEGAELAAERVAERAGGRCDDVTVAGIPGALTLMAWECTEQPFDGRPADFVVVYVSERQRDPDIRARLSEGRELLDVVHVRGIRYAEVYGPVVGNGI